MTPEAAPRLPDTATCLHCGYALRGLPTNVCPECGKSFDPADPETYWETNRPWIAKFVWRRWAYPPPLWHIVLTILTVLLLVEWLHFTQAWTSDTCWMLFTPLFAMLAGLTMSYGIRRWALAFCWWCRWHRLSPQTRSVRVRWAILPICLLFGLIMLMLPPLSLPFMEMKARSVLADGHADNKAQLVGLIPVQRVASLLDGRVKFQIGYGRGIIYHPFSRKLPSGWPLLYEWEVMTW